MNAITDSQGWKETVTEGTLKPDGTLELDQKPNLPSGRVKLVLRQAASPQPMLEDCIDPSGYDRRDPWT